MKIKDIARIEHCSINPQEYKTTIFRHYSFPAYDSGCVPTFDTGFSILSNKFVVSKDTILFNKLNIKFCRIWNVKAPLANSICSSEFIPLVATSKNCLQDYLYYFLLSEKFTGIMLNHVSGTSNSQQRILPKQLLEQEIPIPSIAKQQHIVDILGSIDDKIENNEQIVKHILEYCNSLYCRWACSITERVRLESVIDIFDSKRVPLSSRERADRQGQYPYYGATGVLDHINDYLFSGEYVLIAEDGTVIDEKGNPIVQLVDGKFWVNNHAHILKGKGNTGNYLLYLMLVNMNVSAVVTGAVQLKINQMNLNGLLVPSPKAESTGKIVEEITPFFQKLLEVRKENAKLNELKQLYLKKFFG